MTTTIDLGGITAAVERKAIKHIHLKVYPPDGRVHICAPARVSLEAVRAFALSKLGWIQQQQAKLRAQEREPPREYVDRESHYVWGRRYLLQVVEADAAPAVELTPHHLVLRVRPGADTAKKRAVLDEFYRRQLRAAAPPLIAHWEPILGVQVAQLFVQRMKTRWGSCNPRARHIRLNTELARKPLPCLEYVVVHELVHLLEPSHNARFHALMDQFLPLWRQHRAELNRLPLSHQDWEV